MKKKRDITLLVIVVVMLLMATASVCIREYREANGLVNNTVTSRLESTI